MKLIGELKEKVEKAGSREEAKQALEDAGMQLTDEELNEVAGGKLESILKARGVIYQFSNSIEQDG